MLSFDPSLASADDPTVVEWTQQRVQSGIVQPLTERTPRRFTRERPPPLQRRVRVSEASLARDAQGREFVPFAIDRLSVASEWTEEIVGCAYRASGNLYVKRGAAYFPASLLLGKQVKAVAGACRAAPASS